MRLQLFEMERWQSIWENQVQYNLSESGIHPLRLGEILDPQDEGLLRQSLGYIQTNGTEELRQTIAALYEGASAEDVLVTNGSSESIFVSLWFFLERGSEIALMLPNYMQIWGLAKTFHANLRTFWLRESEDRWVPDIEALRKSVSRKTKLIAVCNPNNPTGATLAEQEIDEIVGIARKVGAWVISDEVYHGAELDGRSTPTFWDRYNKVIITNGLSKAYGLPGLRIGWVVAKRDLANRLWSYHDYTTISPSAISDYLARRVLQPDTRARILERTKKMLRQNLPILADWIRAQRGYFSFIPPKAGAIALLKYGSKMPSRKLATRLVEDKQTLVVPGDHFQMGSYIRVGYGCPPDYLSGGLNRITEWLTEHAPHPRRP